MPEDTVQQDDIVDILVTFGRELREAGLRVGSGDLLIFTAAAAVLDVTDLVDLYWAGRGTLAHRNDELATYDAVFRRFFLDEGAPPAAAKPFSVQARAEAASVLQVPETETGSESREDREARLGLMASDAATLKGKEFGACTQDELVAIRRLIRSMRLTPPRRRTRRTVAGRDGHRPDLRRIVRETMRMHGDPPELLTRRRRMRHRRLVLILDVSGSMADYSRNLLQFAHSTARSTRRVEVFCFGTRLTRITRQLEHRRPDDALDRAARTVVDWEGGTRIGESLQKFVHEWARRGLCRGGIVVICSDGLDRGDPDVLEAAMQRLQRLSHRIVWMNPHKGDAVEFRPSTLGMMVAAPYVDVIGSGHDLNSLEELSRVLPALR